jgi:UDP-N-acetylglucosamine 2-epimerase
MHPAIKYPSDFSSSNISLITPLSREDTINYIKKSKMIITDSGGIQEEACYLHKKVIICRKVTERPESIWLNATLCKTPDYLCRAFWKMLNKRLTDYQCPYGDGHAREKIIEILKKEIV